MEHKFICPIPWVSLSMGANSTPRLCCHQSQGIEVSANENFLELTHLNVIRKKMLKGEIPSQCQGCHELEKSQCVSPRLDYIDRFGNDYQQVKIKYLDITFNNDCNLECMMCSPLYSYKLNKLYHKELNLVHAPSWQLDLKLLGLATILAQLEVITLTGGEPLVSKRSKTFIKDLSSTEFASQITLRIFTNLTFINLEMINILKKFKKVELLLSIDSVGKNYELIRYPASWDKLVDNIDFLNEFRFPHLDVHLHSVLMASNWTHVGELIKFYSSKLAYPNALPIFVEIDTPSFLHPGVLPAKEFAVGLKNIEDALMGIESEDEVRSLCILLEKISQEKKPNLYLQYKVFLNKLIEARDGRHE